MYPFIYFFQIHMLKSKVELKKTSTIIKIYKSKSFSGHRSALKRCKKMHKVGAEGFEPPSAGFHYGEELPPRELMSHRSS